MQHFEVATSLIAFPDPEIMSYSLICKAVLHPKIDGQERTLYIIHRLIEKCISIRKLTVQIPRMAFHKAISKCLYSSFRFIVQRLTSINMSTIVMNPFSH